MKLKTTIKSICLVGAILSSSAMASSITATNKETVNPNTQKSSIKYTIDNYTETSNSVTAYHLQTYRLQVNDELENTLNDLNLIKEKGELIATGNFFGRFSGSFNISTNKTYIESVTTNEKGEKTINEENLKTGITAKIVKTGKDSYFISILNNNLVNMGKFTTGEDTIDLPEYISEDINSTLQIPNGDTAMIESIQYAIDGTKYVNVYLLTVNQLENK